MSNIRDAAPAITLGLACHAALNELSEIKRTKGELPKKKEVLEIFRESFTYFSSFYRGSGYEPAIPFRYLLFVNFQEFQILGRVLKCTSNLPHARKENCYDPRKMIPYVEESSSLIKDILDPNTLKNKRVKKTQSIIPFLLNLSKECISVGYSYMR